MRPSGARSAGRPAGREPDRAAREPQRERRLAGARGRAGSRSACRSTPGAASSTSPSTPSTRPRVRLLLFPADDCTTPLHSEDLDLEPQQVRAASGTAACRRRSSARAPLLRLPGRRPARRRPTATASIPTSCCSTPTPARCTSRRASAGSAACHPGANPGRAPLGVIAPPGRQGGRPPARRRRTPTTPSSTSCTCAASPSGANSGVAPERARHLRRRRREDPLPEGARRHDRRADAGIPVRPAGGQLLGLHAAQLLRAAPAPTAAGARIRASRSPSSRPWSRRCTRPASR